MRLFENACAKANSYINAEKIKTTKDEFIKKNGILAGKIRGPFNTIEYYLY